MNIYLLFILFGIMIFLLLNKYNTFSIGNQFSIYNKPCTCSDGFNIPFQNETSCKLMRDRGTGEEITRMDFFGNECMWTGDTSLITTFDLNIITKLYQNSEKFNVCIAPFIDAGQGYCTIYNMIQQFCFLVGVPIYQSDIDYILSLNLLEHRRRTLKAIEHIFLKNEGLQLLTNNDLIPFINNYNPSEVLEKNKLYNLFIDIRYEDLINISHGFSFYYYNEDDLHKMVIFELANMPILLSFGLENTLIISGTLSDLFKKLKLFYVKLFLFYDLILFKKIMNTVNGDYTQFETEFLLVNSIDCRVLYDLKIREGISLESRIIDNLSKGLIVTIVSIGFLVREDQYIIRAKILPDQDNPFFQDDEGYIGYSEGWTTLVIKNSNGISMPYLLPTNYFEMSHTTNISEEDNIIYHTFNDQLYISTFRDMNKIFNDNYRTKELLSKLNNISIDINDRTFTDNWNINPTENIEVYIYETKIQFIKMFGNYEDISIYTDISNIRLSSFRFNNYNYETLHTFDYPENTDPTNSFGIFLPNYYFTYNRFDDYQYSTNPLTLWFLIEDNENIQKIYISINSYIDYLNKNFYLPFVNPCSVLR